MLILHERSRPRSVSDLSECCFTSTETIRTIRDGHLDFHAALELCFVFFLFRMLLYVHRDGHTVIVQELCESRGGRPGLSVLTSLLVSVDVKLY